MAGDEERRNERVRPGRRDPARGVRREPPIIEGSAEDVTGSATDFPPVTPAETTADHDVAATSSGDIVTPVSEETPVPPPAAEPPPLNSDAATDPVPSGFGGTPEADVTEPAAQRTESASARAERGWSNFATAMAVAVVIMAGAIIYILYRMFAGPDASSEIAGFNSRLAALESRPVPDTEAATRQAAAAADAAAKAQSGLAALTKRVDGLATPQPAQPNLQPQVSDLQGSVTALKKSLSELQTSVAAVPRPDINRIEARFADLDARIGSLQATVSGIPHIDLGPLTGKVDALEARMKPLEAEVQAAQSPERVAERRVAPVAVTAQAISEAISAGQSFPQELRALQALGTDPAKLAPLQTVAANGAPTLADLQDELARLRDRMVAQGTPTPSGSYMDRLMAGAGSLVQVRPLGSVVGDSPAAIVARMNGEIGTDDLAAALADWQKLPEASRTASKELSERLKLRLDAETAARDIATNAIGALATPRG